jgi:hypothetical protein
MKKIIGLRIVHALSIINFGPSRVHALPLGIAAERSVHYIAKLSPSSSFSWADLALFLNVPNIKYLNPHEDSLSPEYTKSTESWRHLVFYNVNCKYTQQLCIVYCIDI